MNEADDLKISSWCRYVVKEHYATRLHYDFRLEINGVLVSWAIPKGPSLVPNLSRLSIRVDDHSVSGMMFEGRFPEGMPGAGPTTIWDLGKFRVHGFDRPSEPLLAGSMLIELQGVRLKGKFLLEHKGESKEWLLTKLPDEHARADWELEVNLTPKEAERYGRKLRPDELEEEGQGTLDFGD